MKTSQSYNLIEQTLHSPLAFDYIQCTSNSHSTKKTRIYDIVHVKESLDNKEVDKEIDQLAQNIQKRRKKLATTYRIQITAVSLCAGESTGLTRAQ